MSNPNAGNPIITLTPAQLEERRRRQRRNAVALGLVLGFLVILFYVLTIVKMGPAVFTTRDL